MAQVTIDSSILMAADRGTNSPSVVFVTAQTGYVFYIDSDGAVVYRKTTDGGATWGSPVTVAVASDQNISVCVWYDRWTPGDEGDLIHVAFIGGSTKDFNYRTLDTSTDTLGTERLIVEDVGTFEATGQYPTICKSKIGNLFAGVGGETVSDIYKSANAGTSWSSTSAPIAFLDEICLVALDEADGDILLVMQDDSQNNLESRVSLTRASGHHE